MIDFSDGIKSQLCSFLRIDAADEEDEVLLEAEYNAAVHFCADYTGQNVDFILTHPVFKPAIFCLVADMYDVRAYSVANDRINPVVSGILGMHSVNLL